MRKTVNVDMAKAYDTDRQFFLSIFKSYLVKAIMHELGMEDMASTPTTNLPPSDAKKTGANGVQKCQKR